MQSAPPSAVAAHGEGDVGGPRVGAVEHEDEVAGEDLHVHRRHADARVEELPLAGERGGRSFLLRGLLRQRDLAGDGIGDAGGGGDQEENERS